MTKLIPELEVIHQDQDLIVINKPCNCHTIGSENSLEQSLANKFPELKDLNESGLVQRLDFETSGVILAARTQGSYEFLKQSIKDHQITKEYLILVDRVIDNILIDNFLGSRYRGSKKVSSSPKAKDRFLNAKTEFYLEESLEDGFSLVRAITNTGRRHQVRVHASDAGSPLIGDSLYGSEKTLPRSLDVMFILHAEKISLPDPHGSEYIEYRAPLSQQLKALINTK